MSEANDVRAAVQDIAIGAVRNERKRQDDIWGVQRHALLKWVAILTEEVGELAQAALGPDLPSAEREATQVAAVAVALIEALHLGEVSE